MIDVCLMTQTIITYIMNEEEDEFFVEPQVEEVKDRRPIQQEQPTSYKSTNQSQEHHHLKMIQIPKQPQFQYYRPFRLEMHSSEQEEQEQSPTVSHAPFKEFYSDQQCVYQRHNNHTFNHFKGTTYHAGQFVHRNIFADTKCNQTFEISSILKDYYDLDQTPSLKPKESDLVFDSHFDSGNLFTAYKISEFQYDLVMSNDTNSIGNNQWFYFAVQGLKTNKEYTFSVINFTKSDSLFNYGLVPVVYSLGENRQVQNLEKGWKRNGKEVYYKKGKLPRQNSHKMYFKLSFKVATCYDRDKLWIAHSYPYTHQKLSKFITDRASRFKDIVQRIQVGKTFSKRVIQALMIRFPINKKRDNRKAIVIMARQHPGQTQGSYVCQGVIERLLTKSKQSEFLLRNYVIYVIPMVNPDGVIFGHYRTNLAGKDLNRKWDAGGKDPNCPQVTSIKSFLTDLHQQREIRFLIDLHGHSKKLNSFFYGNPLPENPEAVRIFPFVCSKLHPGVQYLDCTFATEEDKRKAARVYLSYLYKQIHVYTFESSFYAYEKEGQKIEFTPKEYRDLGSSLMNALYLQLEHEFKYQQSVEFNLKKYNTKQYLISPFVKYLIELKNNKMLLKYGCLVQSGSQSKPEDGEIDNEQLEYSKMIKVQIPNLVADKQSISKSTKVPRRKGTSQIREYPFSRPTRNLRLLEISKINSVLPDKSQFSLQPIKKKEQIVSKLRALQAVAESQTEMIKNQAKMVEISEYEIQNANLAHSFWAGKASERTSVSLVKSFQNRNNVIFKLDFMNQTSRDLQVSNKARKKVHRNAFSQTVITFNKQNPKSRNSQVFPQLQIGERQQGEEWWPKSTQVRVQTPFSSLALKKQAQIYLSGMFRKVMAGKQANRKEQYSHKYSLDKNFSIKRKQIHKK